MLSRVEISNFRSCESVVLTDLEGILALVGRNGAGKTNVLRAIEWASKIAVSTQPLAVDVIQLFSRSALPEVALFFETSSKSFMYSVTQIRIAQEGSRASLSVGLDEKLNIILPDGPKLVVSRTKEKVTLHDRDKELAIGASTPMLKAITALLPEEDNLQGILKDVTSYFERVHYYSLEKLDTSPRFIQGSAYQLWSEALSVSPQFSDDSVAMRLIELKLHRPDDFNEISELVGPNGLNIISKISVEEIRIPTPEISVDDSVDNTEFENQENSSARPDFYLVNFWPAGFGDNRKGQMAFGFDDLSYGTKRLLTIVTSIIFDRSTVLLIEQPEDGIHIGLLNKLTPMLRAYSKDMQFVLASHSRDVLDRFHPSELRLISLNAGKSSARALTVSEIAMAERFIAEEGPLSDFIETLGDD